MADDRRPDPEGAGVLRFKHFLDLKIVNLDVLQNEYSRTCIYRRIPKNRRFRGRLPQEMGKSLPRSTVFPSSRSVYRGIPICRGHLPVDYRGIW